MPFADDVRKYTFASLDNLVNKKGEVVTKHPYIPTEEQQEAMDKFVDAMDLMHAGEKDEEGCVLSPLPALPVIVSVYNLYGGVGIVIRGTTLGCRIIPPYIAQNKHSSIAQSFKTSRPTHFRLHIPNCSSTSTHPRKSSNGRKMPLRNVRRLSR
jgi:hypothetical protein